MSFDPDKNTSLGRVLAIWFVSFAAMGLLLFFYGGVGLYPIIGGGAFTLALTLFRRSRAKP